MRYLGRRLSSLNSCTRRRNECIAISACSPGTDRDLVPPSRVVQLIPPVGAVGLEPTLLLRTRILSPVRLPIPPRPRGFGREYSSYSFVSFALQQRPSG